MLDPFSNNLLWTTFLAALFGSGHCFGMCGGVSALAGDRNLVAYQLGRLTGYLVLGATVGALGKGIVQSISYSPELLLFFYFLSASLLLLQCWNIWKGSMDIGLGMQIYRRLYSRTTQPVIRMAMNRSWVFLYGLTTPLLPCGWIVTFILIAATTASPVQGSMVFLMLWIGSLPALLAAASFWVALRQRLKFIFVQKLFLTMTLLLSVWMLTDRLAFSSHLDLNHLSAHQGSICGRDILSERSR